MIDISYDYVFSKLRKYEQEALGNIRVDELTETIDEVTNK